MKKLLTIFSALILSSLLVSCTKSAGLGGASNTTGATSSNGTMTGTASGGLSPDSGAMVVLYSAGNPPTQLGTATTTSTGAFSISYSNPGGSALFYLLVTGGTTSSGSAINLKNQFLAVAGTGSSPSSSATVNELTTAGTEQVAMNMGLLADSNGTITLSAPKNASGASNVITQFNNMVSSGSLNTSNSNLTTAMKNGLSALANDFASCIENSSVCGTLFTTALSTGSAAAGTVLESGYNALTNSGSISSSMYTLGFPLSSSTGFSLPSSSVPGGFTFNNALPVSMSQFTVGTFPEAIATDSSGNIWVVNNNSPSIISIGSVMKFSSSGTLLTTAATGLSPHSAAIDSGGNLWIANFGGTTITEISSAGAVLGNFPAGTNPVNAAIDSAGNVWVDTAVTDSSTSSIVELSSSGTTLKTFNFNIPVSGNFGLRPIAFDASGNLWVGNTVTTNKIYEINPSNGAIITSLTMSNPNPVYIQFDSSGNIWVENFGGVSGTVNKLNSGGTILGTFSIGNVNAEGFAIDASGNVWVGSGTGGSIEELSSSGTLLATYTGGGIGAFDIAIDPSGNLWASNVNNGTMTKISALTNGPQFFPYPGPQFAQGSY